MSISELQKMDLGTLRLNLNTFLGSMVSTAKEETPSHTRLSEYIQKAGDYLKHIDALKEEMKLERAEAMLGNEDRAWEFKEQIGWFDLTLERIETAVKACEARLPGAKEHADSTRAIMKKTLSKRSKLSKLVEEYEAKALEMTALVKEMQKISMAFHEHDNELFKCDLIEEFQNTSSYKSMREVVDNAVHIISEAILPYASDEDFFHSHQGYFDTKASVY